MVRYRNGYLYFHTYPYHVLGDLCGTMKKYKVFDKWAKVLLFICDNDGCISADIERSEHLSNKMLPALIKRLNVQGLIDVHHTSYHKQCKKILYITEEGKLVSNHIKQIIKLIGTND